MSFQENYDNLVYCLKRIETFGDFEYIKELIRNMLKEATLDKKIELEELLSTIDTVFVTVNSKLAYFDSNLINEIMSYFDDALENLSSFDLRYYVLNFGKKLYYREFENINLINLGYEAKYSDVEFDNEDDAYSYLLNFLDVSKLYQENLMTHDINVKKAYAIIKNNNYRKLRYLLRKYNSEYGEIEEFKKALKNDYYEPFKLKEANYDNYHEAYKFLQILEPAVVGSEVIEELVKSYNNTIKYYITNLAYDMKNSYLKLNKDEKDEIDNVLKYL